MPTVLTTGFDLSGLEASGEYLVTNPVGLPTGHYRVTVFVGPDSSGNTYDYQLAVDVSSGIEFYRAEVEGGFNEWARRDGMATLADTADLDNVTAMGVYKVLNPTHGPAAGTYFVEVLGNSAATGLVQRATKDDGTTSVRVFSGSWGAWQTYAFAP